MKKQRAKRRRNKRQKYKKKALIVQKRKGRLSRRLKSRTLTRWKQTLRTISITYLKKEVRRISHTRRILLKKL